MAIGAPRKARLSVPRVNQNPQPPKLGAARPLATKLASNGGTTAPAAAAKSASTPTNSGGHTYAPTQAQKQAAAAQPSSSLAAAAAGVSGTDFSGVHAAGTTPGSTSAASALPYSTENTLFKIPTWTPSNSGEPDPRDSTYWANLAKLQFQDTQEYNKSLSEEKSENSNYGLALEQAIRARGVQERELGENAIKGNLSASGWLNRTQAEQSTGYEEERGAASREHEAHLQAFTAARKALQQGFGIEAAELLAEAAGRRAESAAEETESGIPEAVPESALEKAHRLGAKTTKGTGKAATGGISAAAGNPYRQWLKKGK